jgi:GGDEF domain-containing protein
MIGAQQVAESIRKRVALPYRIDGLEVQVTAAIGVAIYPDEARSAEALMHLADESMYRAKFGCPEGSEFRGGSAALRRRRDDPSKVSGGAGNTA